MKIIFTLDTLGNSGTEKSTLDIISHFSKEMEVKVVTFYNGNDLLLAYKNKGIDVYEMNLPAGTSWRKAVKPLIAYLKKEKPNLVVSSILRANLISRKACATTNIPLVGTFVSDSYSKIRLQSFTWKRRILFMYYYWLDRLSAGIPKKYISNSLCIKHSNAKNLGISPEKVEVIYRGRESMLFSEKNNDHKAETPFRFVYVARLLQTKGIHELVLAFSAIVKIHPEARLDIYGDGNYKPVIEALIVTQNLSDKVVLHGKIPDGWKKLYEGDCFIFPSWNEGFSGSLIEAMMVGIPIIASDIPMNLEAVTEGKTALTFPVKNVKELASKMIFAIENYEEMKRMAVEARKDAKERFDISVISRQYETVLREVVNEQDKG
jgi:glycosyltransferase involved in cell wall biosynthesis